MTKPSEEVEATAGATKETDVVAKGIKPAKLTAVIVAAVVVALAGIGGGYAYWTHHEGNAYHEAVAPSGNVQLILDIFNKTGVPAYASRLCSGGILSLRNHVAVDVVQFVSPVASVATRGRWSQALNESLPANEPSAVAPGVRERRVLKFADRLNPCVARTVRVLSAPRPGGDPIRVHQRGWRRQPASGAVRRSRCRNVDGEHLPTHAGAAGGFRRDARSAPAIHVNRVELSFTHQCVVYSSPRGGGLMPLLSRTWCKTGGPSRSLITMV